MRLNENKLNLTQEELRRLFSYDPGTGIITRLTGPKRGKSGYMGSSGYLLFNFGFPEVVVLVHRVIWKWMTGEWPKQSVDHINGVKTDNRWSNLRAATHAQNMSNRKLHSNNTSGFKGVQFHENAWHVKVGSKHIGAFKTKEEAASAYRTAAAEIYGEFARFE